MRTTGARSAEFKRLKQQLKQVYESVLVERWKWDCVVWCCSQLSVFFSCKPLKSILWMLTKKTVICLCCCSICSEWTGLHHLTENPSLKKKSHSHWIYFSRRHGVILILTVLVSDFNPAQSTYWMWVMFHLLSYNYSCSYIQVFFFFVANLLLCI